jgi:hypothetical protein
MQAASAKLFDECVADAVSEARTLITKVVQSVVDGLQAQVEQALNSRERQQHQDLLNEVRRVAPQLIDGFVAQFDELLHDKRPEQPRKAALASGLEGLALLDDATVQEDVEVKALIQQIEAKADWEIRDLNALMSALRGEQMVRAEANPLRPEVFGRSLQRAVQSVPLGGEERMALLRSFGGAMSSALKDTYAAYNQRLKARNIQPVGFRAQKSFSSRPGAGGSGGAEAQQHGAAAPHGPGADDFCSSTFHGETMPHGAGDGGGNLFADPYFAGALQSLMRGGPGARAGYMGGEETSSSIFGRALHNERLAGMIQQMALMRGGDAIVQTSSQLPGIEATSVGNVIAQFREDLQSAAQRPIERLTIDVVAMMFDHILGDPRLLSGIKAALGRLQLPVLRQALADPSIFSSRNHPTRKLINRIASYSVGFENAEDLHYQRFLQAVSSAVETIVTLDNEDAFFYAEQLEKIERVIADITKAREAEAAAAVKALERAELRTVLRTSLAHHITTLLAGVEVEDYLREFMRNQWTQVLVEAILQYGEDSDGVRYFKQVGSDLVWSVQPKYAPEDRQHLIKLLPRLVKQLREGLSLIDWPYEQEQKLFAQLMTSHARAIRSDLQQARAPQEGKAAELKKWQEGVARAWNSTLTLDAAVDLRDIAVHSSEKHVAGLIDESDVQDTRVPESADDDDDWPRTEITPHDAGAAEVGQLYDAAIEQLEPHLNVADVASAAAQPRPAPQPAAAAPAERPAAAGRPAATAPLPPGMVRAKPKLLGDNWAQEMVTGTWFKLLLGGKWVKAQLFWKSPKGVFFMFSSNVGGKSHSLTHRALEKMRKEGAFVALESEALVDRAVAGVMAAAQNAAATPAPGAGGTGGRTLH